MSAHTRKLTAEQEDLALRTGASASAPPFRISAVETIRLVAGLAGLMSISEYEDLPCADRVDEEVRELAEVPASDHRVSAATQVGRWRFWPLQDRTGGGVGCVSELVTETSIFDVGVLDDRIEVLRAGFGVFVPVQGHLRR